MEWIYVFYAALFIGALAMFGEVIALGAVIGLGYQVVQWVQTGAWPSYTVGTQLGVPTDYQPTHWVMVDRLLHYVLFNIETAFVVLICAGLAVPLKEWLERDAVAAKSPSKSSGDAPVVSRAQTTSTSVPRVSATPQRPSQPPPPLGMLGRFGVFLGWLFNAGAIICGAVAGLIFINGGEAIIGWALLMIGGGIWLFGRGVRYVLVGPVSSPSFDA